MKARCLCGQVQIQTSAAPLTVRTCWCRDCQYIAAGSAPVNAFFRTETVTITGTLKRYSSPADSGNIITRGFCPQCGTPITTQAEVRPHLIGLRAGAFEERDALAPKLTIWTDSAPEWACIDPDLPSEPRQAPPAG